MPIRIPNIHFWGSSRKIMTYVHLSACLWWAISIRHPAASGKNPEQCGEVGWNKYSSVFHFSQSSPKVTRLMVGQWSGHLQKTSWIWGFLGTSTTLSFKKEKWKSVKRKHLHFTPMDLVISADAQSFIAGQNDAELSHEIYQYSISFFYFCGIFRERIFKSKVKINRFFKSSLQRLMQTWDGRFTCCPRW